METEIARAVIAELQRQGFDTYEEVSLGYAGRRADIVGVRGGLVAVAEVKVCLSLRLLDQATAWRGCAHRVLAAYARGRVGPTVQRYCRHEGIGLWSCGSNEIHEHVAPRLLRRAGVETLRRALCPQQRSGTSAPAGSRGGYWTPFRATVRNLLEVVQEQPGIPLREALAAMSHHYASARSAMSSLPELIRRGQVPGVRVEAGRGLNLYPAPIETDETAHQK